LFNFVGYVLDDATELLDYDGMARLAREHKPKMIVAGATAYPRVIDFEAFRAVADEVGAILLVDAAHIAGLVAGGAHPSPVPYADVVTFTTHKTLRGPRAGAIVCREQYATAIDKSVFPGLQGGPLMHVIAAKAVAFREAMQPEFREYAAQIVRNAAALADALTGEGFRIVSGGTDNHLLLVDLRPFGVTGKVAQEALDRAGITTNKNTIPNDPEKPFVTSGLRLGTASVTTAGMGEPEMAEIASVMAQVLRSADDETVANDAKDTAARLCSKFTPYPELA
jgi:glycine hydroxymethyltransferase